MGRTERLTNKGKIMTTTTIQAHYNTLLSSLEQTKKSLIENEMISTYASSWGLSDIQIEILISARRLIADEAARIAKEDWARVMADLASQSKRMPMEPTTYELDDGAKICRGRDRVAEEPNYLKKAFESVLPELQRRTDEAQRRFDAYRQAIIQGVAVAPEESVEK